MGETYISTYRELNKAFLCCLAFAAIFLIVNNPSFSQQGIVPKKTSDRVAFNALKKGLLQGTGKPYLYTDSITMELAFDSLALKLNAGLSKLEKYRAYCKVVSLMNDGHTQINPTLRLSGKFFKKPFTPPLDVDLIDAKLYVAKGYRAAKRIEVGDEIIQINGVDLPDILSEIHQYQSSDGHNETMKNQMMRNFFWFYYWLFFEEHRNFSLKLSDKYGNEYTSELKGVIPKPAIYKKIIAEEREISVPRKIGYPTLSIHENSNYAYLKIGTFFNPNQKKYEETIRDHMKSLNMRQVDNLIIDLRNNSGGRVENYILGVFLDTVVVSSTHDFKNIPDVRDMLEIKTSGNMYGRYHVIMKERDEMLESGVDVNQYNSYSVLISDEFRFKGNLVVLVNGHTFSAASVLASQLKYHANAVIIGEETGGSYLHGNSGQLLFRIPYYNFKLFINPLYFNSGVEDYQDYKGGLLPDIKVKESFHDKSDLYIEAAKSYFEQFNLE